MWIPLLSTPKKGLLEVFLEWRPNNLAFGPGLTHHRALVATCVTLAAQQDALFHTHLFSEHSYYPQTNPTPTLPPTTDPNPYKAALHHAATILHAQYNHHSHYVEHTFSISPRTRPPIQTWMNELPLHHRQHFTPHHMHPLYPTFDSNTCTSSPLIALHTYYASTTLPSPYSRQPDAPTTHLTPSANQQQHISESIMDILNTHHSPLLFSSDSSQTWHHIVTTSVLMALDRTTPNLPWTTLLPIPLNIRTHFLPYHLRHLHC